jgi:Tol biopolymer transport system component
MYGSRSQCIAVVVLVGMACMVGCRAESTPPPPQPTGVVFACHAAPPISNSDVPCDPHIIYVISGDGTDPTEVGKGEFPSWSPDGRLLAASTCGSIQILDIAMGTSYRSVDISYDIDAIAWSPDGRRIAFRIDWVNSGLAPRASIWVVHADGSDAQQLTSYEWGAGVGSPSWSSDSTRIAYDVSLDWIEGDLPWHIHVMNSDGSYDRQLTEGPASYTFPRWSPQGGKIACRWVIDGELHVLVMDEDGTDQTPLAEGTLDGWSLDGRSIYFHRDDEMFVMSADGSDQISLGKGILYGSSPDGSTLFFHLPDDDYLWSMDSDGSNRTQLFELECEDPVWSPVLAE